MVDYHVGLVRNFPKYNNVGSLLKELWYYKNNACKIWIIEKQQPDVQKNHKYRL